MALKTNTAEGQPTGTAATTANTGGGSGDALTLVVGAGTTWTFLSAAALQGSMGYELTCTTAASTMLGDIDDVASASATFGASFFFQMNGAPSATIQFPINARSTTGGGSLGRVQMNTAMQVQCVAGATTGTFSAASLSLGVVYRGEWVGAGYNTAATSGTLNVYLGNTMTVAATCNVSGATTAALVDRMRWGKVANTGTVSLYLDHLRQNIGNGGVELGPLPSPPVVRPRIFIQVPKRRKPDHLSRARTLRFNAPTAILTLTGAVNGVTSSGHTVSGRIGDVGAVTGTTTASSTLVGVVGEAGAVTGTTTAASTLVAVVALAGSVTGTTTAAGTVAGAAGAVGSVTGTTAAATTVAGVDGRVGAITASTTASPTVTGSVAAGGVTGSVTGTTTGGGTVTGQVAAAGATSGTTTAAGTVAGVVARASTATGTTTASPTVSGAVGDVTGATGTTVAAGTVVAVVALTGAVSGSTTAGGTVIGTTVSGVIGSVNGTTTTGGTVVGVVALSGAVVASTTAAGTVVGQLGKAGLITASTAAAGTVAGTLGRFGAVTGTTTGAGTVASSTGLFRTVTGTTTAASTVIAAAGRQTTAAGTTTIGGTVVGVVTIPPSITLGELVGNIGNGTTGSVGAGFTVLGTLGVSATMSGSTQ